MGGRENVCLKFQVISLRNKKVDNFGSPVYFEMRIDHPLDELTFLHVLCCSRNLLAVGLWRLAPTSTGRMGIAAW